MSLSDAAKVDFPIIAEFFSYHGSNRAGYAELSRYLQHRMNLDSKQVAGKLTGYLRRSPHRVIVAHEMEGDKISVVEFDLKVYEEVMLLVSDEPNSANADLLLEKLLQQVGKAEAYILWDLLVREKAATNRRSASRRVNALIEGGFLCYADKDLALTQPPSDRVIVLPRKTVEIQIATPSVSNVPALLNIHSVRDSVVSPDRTVIIEPAPVVISNAFKMLQRTTDGVVLPYSLPGSITIKKVPECNDVNSWCLRGPVTITILPEEGQGLVVNGVSQRKYEIVLDKGERVYLLPENVGHEVEVLFTGESITLTATQLWISKGHKSSTFTPADAAPYLLLWSARITLNGSADLDMVIFGPVSVGIVVPINSLRKAERQEVLRALAIASHDKISLMSVVYELRVGERDWITVEPIV